MTLVPSMRPAYTNVESFKTYTRQAVGELGNSVTSSLIAYGLDTVDHIDRARVNTEVGAVNLLNSYALHHKAQHCSRDSLR